MSDDGSIAAALDRVGSRLKRVRKERGVTLHDLAERTGISTSTLSRLENGQRRPSLELLLPLAQAYRVPLDDLVGAPEVGTRHPKRRGVGGRQHGQTVESAGHGFFRQAVPGIQPVGGGQHPAHRVPPDLRGAGPGPGEGRFHGDEDFQGKTVRVRYIWSRVTPTSCRWEQAWSTDGEQSWETNWIMDFTRVSDRPADEPRPIAS